MVTLLSELSSVRPPTEAETRLARESSRSLAKFLGPPNGKNGGDLRIRIQSEDGPEETVSIPRSALQLLGGILAEMAQGHAVTLTSIHAELIAPQAADLLNVSVEYLSQQLDQGAIPFRQVGAQRRLLFRDVMAFKEQSDRNRLRALEELAAQAQELNMGY